MDKADLNKRNFFKNSIMRLFNDVKESVNQVNIEIANDNDYKKILRPPGALPKKEFYDKCTKCDECVSICPELAILKHLDPDSKNHLTPTFKFHRAACSLCDDFPCVTVCKPGALIRPVNIKDVKIGIAKVNKKLCIAWNGQVCDYCFLECPFPNEAIFMKDGKPVVIEEKCVGCGKCEYICPAKQMGIKVY